MSTNNSKTSLSSILFNKTRGQVLALLYGHTDEQYYLRQVVRKTNAGLGAVQRELKQLVSVGLIHRSISGHQVYFQANQRSPIYKELRSLITKTVGVRDVLKEALQPYGKRIAIAFVFGSVARGEENQRSDVDLMIIGSISFSAVVAALDGVENVLGREVNPVIYPQKEFCSKLAEGHHFVNSVVEEEKIFVIGDENRLTEISK
jgi:predicted nucleotidyltransferase